MNEREVAIHTKNLENTLKHQIELFGYGFIPWKLGTVVNDKDKKKNIEFILAHMTRERKFSGRTENQPKQEKRNYMNKLISSGPKTVRILKGFCVE